MNMKSQLNCLVGVSSTVLVYLLMMYFLDPMFTTTALVYKVIIK